MSIIWSALIDAFLGLALSGVFVLPLLCVGGVCAVIVLWTYRGMIERPDRARAFGFVVCFAVFGMCLGLLAGFGEKAPLVEQLLAPFLALFTAAVTYMTNRETPPELKALVPGAMVAFLLNVLLAFYYGRFYENVGGLSGSAML